jgi:putative iron-regulated protein
VDKEVTTALNQTVADMEAMAERAKTKEAYDQMIGEGNDEGNAVVQKAIDALLVQTKAIERAVAALELNAIEFEGSESLDAPDKVKKAEAESK